MSNVKAALLSGLLALAFTGSGSAQNPAPKPPPKAASATPAKPETPPSLERINGYFNSIKGLQADFVQLAPDGRKFGGVLYLLRPGRLRFEYAKPATLEIVADGREVAIRDRKVNTQDRYPIGQTPLKFLLAQKIDVAKDSKVTDLKRVGNDIVLSLEDKSTLGGTSKIQVFFNGETYALKEWTVTDPQGADTRVTLTNLNLSTVPDVNLFVITDLRANEIRN